MRLWLVAVGGLMLAGCSLAPGYSEFKTIAAGALDQAVIDRQNYNDAKAEVVTTLTCDISVGAYARMAAGDVKRGVGLICGLGDSQPATVLLPTGDGRFAAATILTPPALTPPVGPPAVLGVRNASGALP